MGYRIKRKFSNFDEGYVDRWGEKEGCRFEAKEFHSREEAQRHKHQMTWKLDGLSEDFEITDR